MSTEPRCSGWAPEKAGSALAHPRDGCPLGRGHPGAGLQRPLSSRIPSLLFDQASLPGGTVADELGVPFATVCNALLLNPDPAVPSFSTRWRPQDAWWARFETGSRGRGWTDCSARPGADPGPASKSACRYPSALRRCGRADCRSASSRRHSSSRGRRRPSRSGSSDRSGSQTAILRCHHSLGIGSTAGGWSTRRWAPCKTASPGPSV